MLESVPGVMEVARGGREYVCFEEGGLDEEKGVGVIQGKCAWSGAPVGGRGRLSVCVRLGVLEG